MAEFNRHDYLEDLFGYANLRIRFDQDDEPLDVEQVAKLFATAFLQPYDRLIENENDETRSVGERQVLQLQIAVEILRAYLEPLQVDTTTADSGYLQRAYREILMNVGTSFDELRMLRAGGDEDEHENEVADTRHALADRLGIAVERVDELFIDPTELTEATLEEVFGLPSTTIDPFEHPQADPALLQWRADHLRQGWQAQQASAQLGVNGDRPIIDPDLLSEAMIIDPDQIDVLPGIGSELIDATLRETPLELWHARTQEIEEIGTELQTTIEDTKDSQPTVLAAYNAVLETSVGDADVEAALKARTEGDLETQPDELGPLGRMDLAALRRLVRIRNLAESGMLTNLEWADTQAILVQFTKQRRYGDWVAEERGRGLFVSPDFFRLPDGRPRRPLPPWRATSRARLEWEATVKSRAEQFKTAGQALETAIDETQNSTLVGLRESLIEALASHLDHSDSRELAETLTRRLFVDFRTRDDRKTTRLEQAVETLQSVFFALRMGRIHQTDDVLSDVNPAADWDLDLITESQFEQFIFTETDFDEDWHWMGTYATRRAAEFVKEHPENYLRPSLLRDVDEGTGSAPTDEFWTFIDELRARSQLTPKQARTIANEYLAAIGAAVKIDNDTLLRKLNDLLVIVSDDLTGGSVVEPFELTEQVSESDLVVRRALVRALFEEFAGVMDDEFTNDEGDTIQIRNPHLAPSWLQEIFYFVPMAIALNLQRSGRYLDALDWYQTVYAYQFTDQPDTDTDERKIYHGLDLEGEFSERPRITPDTWLRTELHPHSLARQRRWAYTRFTIMAIIQCLLEYADAEFTSETSESLSRARALYLMVLDLLDLPEIPPTNPMITSLRGHAEINVEKLRSGRNIAGMELPSGPNRTADDGDSPVTASKSRFGGRRTVSFQPTPYRYAALVEQAKHLVTIAQQMESAFLAALEKRDGEAYTLLQADQDLQLTDETVQLQNMRVKEADGNIGLATLQQERAQIQLETYEEWLATGLNGWEKEIIENYWKAAEAQKAAAEMSNGASILGAWSSISSPMDIAGFGVSAVLGEAELWQTTQAITAQTRAQVASLQSTFERRRQEWELQANLTLQDVEISTKQIELAQDHLQVVQQERAIAGLQADHAKSEVDFLANKFTNVELYEWMSGIIGRVYSYFLQQATAMARLAQNQLAFQRQDPSLSYIRADYWEPPAESGGSIGTDGEEPDRRGLTGSARLLQDIYRLDQYAFETDQRKLQLKQTFSLAQLAPFEFQQFRETGVLRFATPMELFDRSFPGQYLRQIKRVRTSLVALVPPTQGIRATLTASGLSKVVIGGHGEPFRTATVRRQPEQIALTSPTDATGLFELQSAREEDLLLPFEHMGVDTSWELRMPKATNPFDYTTIADVLFTIEYTALDSPDYRQQLVRTLANVVSAERAFSFRDRFADQWYDLHHPNQTDTPMTVRFEIRREDFPPNLDDLRIQQVLLYFARTEDAHAADDIIEVGGLHLTTREGDTTGGAATSMTDGTISTRRSNGTAWIAMVGESPVGAWELTLPDTEDVRNRFNEGQFDDVLLVLSFEGRTPEWPA